MLKYSSLAAVTYEERHMLISWEQSLGDNWAMTWNIGDFWKLPLVFSEPPDSLL